MECEQYKLLSWWSVNNTNYYHDGGWAIQIIIMMEGEQYKLLSWWTVNNTNHYHDGGWTIQIIIMMEGEQYKLLSWWMVNHTNYYHDRRWTIQTIIMMEGDGGSESSNNKYSYLSRQATTWLTPSSSSAYSSKEMKARLLPSASWLPVTLTYSLSCHNTPSQLVRTPPRPAAEKQIWKNKIKYSRWRWWWWWLLL